MKNTLAIYPFVLYATLLDDKHGIGNAGHPDRGHDYNPAEIQTAASTLYIVSRPYPRRHFCFQSPYNPEDISRHYLARMYGNSVPNE